MKVVGHSNDNKAMKRITGNQSTTGREVWAISLFVNYLYFNQNSPLFKDKLLKCGTKTVCALGLCVYIYNNHVICKEYTYIYIYIYKYVYMYIIM